MIQLNEVSKSFGNPPTQVLHGISNEIRDGEFVALTGRSGSGKSTLLYIASSLDAATTGTVKIDGEEISRMNEDELHEFRNRNMGFIFQFHYLLPELSALENVLFPARKYRVHPQKKDEAESLLEDFGLGGKLGRLPGQLSGGEQQRVAIARALIMSPKYIFADEPTGNLDSINGETVMRILQQINSKKGTTIVMVTHDPDFAQLASRRVHLADGKVVSHEDVL